MFRLIGYTGWRDLNPGERGYREVLPEVKTLREILGCVFFGSIFALILVHVLLNYN